eukprot:sb/3465330/
MGKSYRRAIASWKSRFQRESFTFGFWFLFWVFYDAISLWNNCEKPCSASGRVVTQMEAPLQESSVSNSIISFAYCLVVQYSPVTMESQTSMQEESKLDRFKVGTKKFIGRTNERLKQRIGRSSEAIIVKDDKWQVHVANFNRQQALALKLHREVKGYIASLKTMEGSAHSLMEVVREMHEFTWPGNMNLVKALQSLEKLNMELSNSMVDTLLVPVNNYVETFPEIKERMNKRERKLLDYTRCKRNLDTLKKGDKISHEKLGLAQEEFTEHKMIYEEVNNELSEDLPQFWDSRKPFISRFLDTFFEQNVGYSKEFSQVYSECHAAVEPLKESIRGDPPASRQIGNVERFFIISDNARKFKRQSLRKSFRKSNGGGGGFKRSLSMGAIRKTKKEDPVPQSMSK